MCIGANMDRLHLKIVPQSSAADLYDPVEREKFWRSIRAMFSALYVPTTVNGVFPPSRSNQPVRAAPDQGEQE